VEQQIADIGLHIGLRTRGAASEVADKYGEVKRG
jgi:hypothetical protein